MPGASETPLATYTERLPQVRRDFRLYPDRVEVAARWTLGRSFRNTVRLADLSGQVNRFTVKNRWFPRAVMVGSCAVAFALVLSRSGYPELLRRTAALGWPVAGVAFLVALLCLPRRQFVHFPRSDGRPGLDICRAGPDRAQFEAFVGAVRKCIRQG
jgi:hypothetical protein